MTETVSTARRGRTPASQALGAFIAHARQVAAQAREPADMLNALSSAFSALLSDRGFLDEELLALKTEVDEVCLYHDSDHEFVVLARGACRTAIRQGSSHASVPHDHGPLWALYGLYEGTARLQRYVPDPAREDGPFPGLRMVADSPAGPGSHDAIEPHQLHLPVFPPQGGSVIIVVYARPLGLVVRRGYMASRRTVVDFQGPFPPA